MATEYPVLYSFGLYVLFILLPIIPAAVIFRLFPDTKVAVSGPLQNLTINASGAFGAYIVTAALSFFLVQNVESQIDKMRAQTEAQEWFNTHYPVAGVIANLEPNQFINSDQFYWRQVPSAESDPFKTNSYYFITILDHPLLKTEKVWVKYWESNASSGTGAPPLHVMIPLELKPTNQFPERFTVTKRGNQLAIEPVPTS